MGVSKDSRPRKRLGGGGYGQFKSMNNPSDNRRLNKTQTYRQMGKKHGDKRQFVR